MSGYTYIYFSPDACTNQAKPEQQNVFVQIISCTTPAEK
jgi:hypothetical protein